MPQIRKVTRKNEPEPRCAPGIGCAPSTLCAPMAEHCVPQSCIPQTICQPKIHIENRSVNGTYIYATPGGDIVLALRVEVDEEHPPSKVSGDRYFPFLIYPGHVQVQWIGSFTSQNVAVTTTDSETVLTGWIKYSGSEVVSNDTFEIHIPCVPLGITPPPATVTINTSLMLIGGTHICQHTSDSFRTTHLEIDKFQGTEFPAAVLTNVDPYPADLPVENLTTAEIYKRAGIDMTVTEDNVLNDPDEAGAEGNWSLTELHDLMENHFDHFENKWQWNLYGAVVPWLESPYHDPDHAADPGFFGVMFDVAEEQPGDLYFRQGCAIAYNAMNARVETLYNAPEKKNRLILKTFVEEIGHAYNLVHSFNRKYPTYASVSFMNYPWLYSDPHQNLGGEEDYWANFRWEFDDVELAWLRHAHLDDIIFGSGEVFSDNIDPYSEMVPAAGDAPLVLEARAKDIFECGEPVQVELSLCNASTEPLEVVNRLAPEDGLVQLYITSPDGQTARYAPPVSRVIYPQAVQLAPGEAITTAVMISYGARGMPFVNPGEYRIRAVYQTPTAGAVSRDLRIRVAAPAGRENEELAHLMFHPSAAKFLYFGGSERYPEIAGQLAEAAERYAKTSPATVRHIHAALGQWQSAPLKQVTVKDRRRVVTQRPANLEVAARHLEAARVLIPSRREAAFTDTGYEQVTRLLAKTYEKQGQPELAKKVLEEGQRYLRRR